MIQALQSLKENIVSKIKKFRCRKKNINTFFTSLEIFAIQWITPSRLRATLPCRTLKFVFVPRMGPSNRVITTGAPDYFGFNF